MTWYAVRVGPSMEKKVARAFSEHGVESYYPVEKVWRSKRSQGRRMTAERPKARGYVFANGEAAALVAMVHDLDGALEVLGFAYTNEHVAAWIARLRVMEAAGDFDETLPRDRKGKIKHKLEVGDRVHVNGGLYYGASGTVLRFPGRRKAVIEAVWLHGQIVKTEIDLEHLEAA